MAARESTTVTSSMPTQPTFLTQARWFGPDGRPLLGWWTEPPARARRSGIVILPPIGYEYWSAHRTLRTLAEKLAERGHGVLRMDYDGLGDSAGDRWDDGRVPAWKASIARAVEEVRGLGAETITLVGLRMGATLALTEAKAVGADAVVAWVPVTSGKRFMKELRMLGLAVPATDERPEPGNTIVYAGTVFSPETAAAVSAIDLDKLAEKPAARVLVVARPDRPVDKLVARLGEVGSETQLEVLPGVETALDIPAEGATVPTAILDVIARWIGRADEAKPNGVPVAAAQPPRPSAQIQWNGGALTEEVRQLGEPGLIGVCGIPAGTPKETCVVFLNSGSEPHTGPGRCWVEYTRELNLRGYPTVRLDFSGWGESPDRGHAPGRPYDPHCIDEAIAVTAALRNAGHKRVVLAGLCAGAWIGMRAALHAKIDAVIAINPQLYWKPGEPLDVRIVDTRKRREPIRAMELRGKKWKLWSALDLVGVSNYAGRWLTRLARQKSPVLLLFSEGDEGIEFLHNRLSRRLAQVTRGGSIKMVQVDDVDHQMYREWRRGDVVARIVEYLEALPRS
jgi:pimeloyl-ACP methyl ester carboxylesterase